jgi:hypothetical protein
LFSHVTGIDLGRGVVTTWMNAGPTRLAEATAWRVFEQHREAGQASAQTLARDVHLADGRQPRLVAADATLLARPGGEEALDRAIKICDEALGTWDGSTAYGSPALRAERGRRRPEPPRLTMPEYFLTSLSYE